MRVINIILSEFRGGAEAVHISYSALLVGKVDSLLTIFSSGSRYFHDANALGLRFKSISCFGSRDIFAMIRLRAIIKNERAEKIICHCLKSFLLTRFIVPMGCSVIYVAHNDRLKRRSGASHYIVLTPAMREKLVSSGISKEKVSLVENSFRFAADLKNFPDRVRPDKIVLGYAGRLTAEKGVSYFIDLISALRSEYPIAARIAGDGPLMHDISARINEDGLNGFVFLDGWVDDISHWLQNIDILVLPSLSETFGLVLIEAMACGKLVSSSDTDGASYIFSDAFEKKFIFKRGDLVSCIDAVKWILDNEDYWPILRRYNIDRSLEFRPEKISEKLLNAICSA